MSYSTTHVKRYIDCITEAVNGTAHISPHRVLCAITMLPSFLLGITWLIST